MAAKRAVVPADCLAALLVVEARVQALKPAEARAERGVKAEPAPMWVVGKVADHRVDSQVLAECPAAVVKLAAKRVAAVARLDRPETRLRYFLDRAVRPQARAFSSARAAVLQAALLRLAGKVVAAQRAAHPERPDNPVPQAAAVPWEAAHLAASPRLEATAVVPQADPAPRAALAGRKRAAPAVPAAAR